MKIEDQIADLQSQFAHQELSLQELSDALYAQQRRIDGLEREVTYLRNELKKQTSVPPNINQDEAPPHY